MAFEPVVAPDANVFAPLTASTTDPVANMQQAIAFRVGLAQQQAQTQQLQQQSQEIATKVERAQQFQKDVAAVGQNPDANSISALITKYPEFAEQIKSGWDVKDSAAKQTDLTSLGELYSAAAGGSWDLAFKRAQERLQADQTAGKATDADQKYVDLIQSAAGGDEGAKKTVLTTLGTNLAAVTGPDHFASVYGALKGGYTLDAGATRYDDNGNVVAQSPFIKGGDGTIYERDGTPQGTTPTGATTAPGSHPINASPQAAAVASELTSAGLPAPVVAGFMGNFHVEGGFDGAQGDGGSASGIAQWHNDRAANFERVIGKPVTQASPAEQAQFVAWEMQHPEAAGMTVTQRDAIMNAKTAPQAAALIDQYYERSSGKDRQGRMTAASAFAAGGGPNDPASAAPAGYHVLVPGSTSPDQYHTLTDAEVKQRNLDPSQQYQLNTKTGQVTGLGQKTGGDDVLSRYNIAPGETGPSMLAKVPAGIAAQIKALSQGRLPMPSSFALAKPYWQTLLQLTSQYDPTFDASSYPARKAAITAFTGMGKGAQVVGSVNRVANHLQLLWNESQKLVGPDTGFGPLNTAVAATGQMFQPQDAKAYDTEVQFIAGELEKIARNSPGTASSVDQIIKNLSRTGSTSTRASAINAAVGIISGAIDPLKEQYNSAFTNNSTRPNIPWVTPAAQRIYKTIGGVDMSLTGSSAGTNATTNAPPSKTIGGKTYYKVNGKWYDNPEGR